MQLLPNTTNRFLHAHWAVRQRVVHEVGPALKNGHDLDFPDVFLLQHVRGSARSPTEIAGAMQVPSYTVSRRLGALTDAGLLVRSLDPEDSRRRRLALTSDGEARLDAALATLHEGTGRILAVLEPAALQHLLASLEAIAGAADGIGHPATVDS